MLLQVLLTRWLLELSKERFAVKFFVRADVDSMLPLQFLLPLLQHAAAGRCLSLVFPGLRLLFISQLCLVSCEQDSSSEGELTR